MPNSTRPSARWSSRASFSATRSGSFHGRITAPVPSRICVGPRRHVGEEHGVVGTERVVVEVVLDRPQRVEAELVGEHAELDLVGDDLRRR